MSSSTDRRRAGSKSGLSGSQLLLLVITAMVILYFGYRQFARHFGSQQVVVAKEAIVRGQTVGNGQVKTSRVPKGEVPDDALLRIGDVVGQTIRNGVDKGEILRAADFAQRQLTQTDLKKFITEGRVLYGLNLANQTLPPFGIMQGDSIDIMVAGPSSEDRVRIANVLVRDALMVGYSLPGAGGQEGGGESNAFGVDLSPPPPSEDDEQESTLLMLAVLPKDVVRLAEADGAGHHLSIVLHAAREEGEERLRVTNRDRVQLIQGKASQMIPLP